MVTRAADRSRGAPSLLAIAVAGYAGYRIAKSPRLRAILVVLSVFLFMAAVLYGAFLLLKLVAALVMTAVHYTVRSRRTWLWMRITWGVLALSVVQLRAGRKLPSRVVTPIVIGWLNTWPVTARRIGP